MHLGRNTVERKSYPHLFLKMAIAIIAITQYLTNVIYAQRPRPLRMPLDIYYGETVKQKYGGTERLVFEHFKWRILQQTNLVYKYYFNTEFYVSSMNYERKMDSSCDLDKELNVLVRQKRSYFGTIRVGLGSCSPGLSRTFALGIANPSSICYSGAATAITIMGDTPGLTLVHELGHILGACHNKVRQTVMYGHGLHDSGQFLEIDRDMITVALNSFRYGGTCRVRTLKFCEALPTSGTYNGKAPRYLPQIPVLRGSYVRPLPAPARKNFYRYYSSRKISPYTPGYHGRSYGNRVRIPQTRPRYNTRSRRSTSRSSWGRSSPFRSRWGRRIPSFRRFSRYY
jgi:hypothetical protein